MKMSNTVVALSAAAVGCLVGAWAFAEPTKNAPEFKLPAGWTPEDMQKCMSAGTPGAMHEFLAKGAGKWQGNQMLWMGPGAEGMASTCTAEHAMIMDGRFAQYHVEGEMPGMGPFRGMGIMGYDNVSKKFVASWVDNHGTGIMQGLGTLSDDQKSMTWNYTYNCPITGKPATMREVDTFDGDNKFKMVMFATDPKSGKEYKMCEIDYTR